MEDQETIERIIKLKAIKRLRRSKDDKDIEEIEKFLDEYPDDTYGMVEAARIYLKRNNFIKAEEYLKKVYNSAAPNKYSALVLLGGMEEKKNNLEQAKMYYRKAIAESPNVEIFAIRSLARFAKSEGNLEEAEEFLKLLESNALEYYVRDKAEIAFEKGEYEEAITLLDMMPDDASKTLKKEALLIRGRCFSELGFKREALYYFSQAKKGYYNEIDYIYFRASYEEAKIFFEKGYYRKAEKICYNIKNYQEESVQFLLAKISDAKGLIQKAKDYYEEAINIKNRAVKCECAFYLGNLAIEMEDYEEALKYYKIILDDEVFSKKVYYELIAICLRQEDYYKAWQYLNYMAKQDESVKNDGTFVTIKFYLEHELGKLDNIDMASLSYKEKQIVDYSMEDAIRYTINYYKNNFLAFRKDIDISELMVYLKANLTKENKINTMVFDTYDVNYEEVGYVAGKVCNKVRVTTIPNTNNIIKIYPVNDVTLKDKINQEKQKKQAEKKEKMKFLVKVFKF